jgi:uncharacterized RDD family membrane protein YckC
MREEPLNLPLNPYAPPVADDYAGLDDELDQDIPAAPGARFAAAMIDAVLMYAPLVLLGGLAYMISDTEAALTTVGLTAVLLLTPIGILQLVWISSRGQTIGKRVMGIKIVKMDMTPGGFWSFAVVRGGAVPLLSGIIDAILPLRIGSLLILIDCLFVFAKDHRCLHDHLAKTRVVMVKKSA